tara:strand:- start:392 stop:1078 length:687 start_codon:yes stop_codon:yes gene_type:complete
MKVLELFSGSGSVGKVCKLLGYECVSVDIEFDATHKVDILEFDYKQYKCNEFDIVWGSPPCTYYSTLQKTWIGKQKKDGIYTIEKHNKDLEYSDTLVLKTLEIIDYFKPKLWFMENPQTGTLKTREVVKDLPFYDIDYCMYSDWGYRKRTRIWTNKKDFNAKKCDGKGTCGNMILSDLRKHKMNVATDVHNNKGRTKHKTDVSIDVGSGTNRLERYRIPEKLIMDLFI